jgi:LacI family transcriptional regulator
VYAALSTRVTRLPDALLDRVAMGVYQAAADLRLRIPRDLSVASFDNSELSRWLAPELTSIGLPYFEMGRRSVEVLLGASTTPAAISPPITRNTPSPGTGPT